MFFGLLIQAQIDGNVVRARFTLPPRQKASSPPKAVSAAPKREAPPRENAGADTEKDGLKRPRECRLLVNCYSGSFISMSDHMVLMPEP